MKADSIRLPALSQSALTAFFQGMGLVPRGLGFLLQRPGLWPLVLIPLVVNIVVFILFLVFGFGFFSDWLNGLIYSPGVDASWYIRWGMTALRILADIFFWLIVMLLVYFTFTPVALLIASPFNDRIAEHAERACGHAMINTRSLLRSIAGEAVFSVLSEFKRLIVFGGVFVLLLPLNLLPAVGSLGYGVLVLIWGCFGSTVEFMSYAADRRRLGMRKKMVMARERMGLTMGFGALVFLLFMIPFLNVFIMPVAAAGGSFLFCMMREAELRES